MEIDRLLADWGGSLLAAVSIVCLFRKSLWYWYAALGSSALWFYLFVDEAALMVASLQVAYALFAAYGIARWRREQRGASLGSFDRLGTAIAAGLLGLAVAASRFDGWTAYVELAAVALSILANWLTARKVVWCWPVWMSTNVLFAALFLEARLWGLFTMQFVFFALSVVGWRAWARERPPAARRRGLVLGKFAPLHRGHQHLIATAAAAVEELVVVVYDTAWFDAVPATARARWIEELHPGAEVVVLPDLPPDSFDERTATAAYARQLAAALGPFTDVFTSEAYGDELAARLGSTHTAVDPSRSRFPISATELRGDVAAARRWVDPLVWRSLVPKVVLLGAESTGKTTLARALGARLGTVWVPEYGRELWEAKAGALELDDLERIGREQLAREVTFAQAADGVLVCDTNALATVQWSRRLFGRVSPGLARLAAETAREYVTFLCEHDFAWTDDGTRETAAAQAVFQRAVRADLDERRIPYVTLRGTVDARLAAVEAALAQAGWKRSPLTSLG